MDDDGYDRYEFGGLSYRYDHEPSDIQFMCRGRKFHVDISPSDLGEHQAEYARLITALREDSDSARGDEATSDDGPAEENEDDSNDSESDFMDPLDRFAEWAVEPVRPFFRTLAPELHPGLLTVSLSESFSPPTYYFNIKSINGVLEAVPSDTSQCKGKPTAPSVLLKSSLFRSDLMLIHPDNLTIQWDPEVESCPKSNTVYCNGLEQYYLKQAIPGIDECMEREAEVLLQIQDLDISGKVRVPRLHGYVQFEEENRISGLLLQHLKTKGDLATVVDRDNPPPEQKQQWFGDIQAILGILHQGDLVWGDAKAENVLIDEEGNAWMIDFGGSYTPGWVDEEHKNTKKGDLQGLARIKDFLEL